LVETRLGRLNLRRLDTSNGCQDHTVLPYAAHRFAIRLLRALPVRRSFSEGGAPVVRTLRSLTGDKPALRSRHAPDAAASTATRPSFLTMANAPLGGTGWGRCRGDLGVASREISLNRKIRLSERWHHVDAVVDLDGTRRAKLKLSVLIRRLPSQAAQDSKCVQRVSDKAAVVHRGRLSRI
jgi:hypothetical protein